MATLQKQYLYKSSRNGVFLGTIDNVISTFNYSQNINSAGSSMDIQVAINPFVANNSVDTIATESGDDIITESGDIITTERQADLVGNSNSLSLIRSYNDVEVYEFSPNNPNGKIVFKGYISKWKANFGGSNVVNATIVSYGTELDNYLIQGSDTVDLSQSSSNSNTLSFSWGKDQNPAYIIQSFQPSSSATNFAAMEFKIAAATAADIGKILEFDIYATLTDAQNGINSLGSTSQAIVSTTATVQKFSVPSVVTVSPLATYYGRVRSVPGVITNFYVYYQNSDVYANGLGYYNDGSTLGVWTLVGGDFYFKTYYTAGATSAPYSSVDPTAIVESIIDSYVGRGGTINYSAATMDLTNTSVSYTFKVNTVLEGIKKALELSPYNWYFYVDPATNLLYFKQTGTTADHIMILGRHIKELNIEANVEQLKNVVYFSGGPTGGVNLYTSLTDAQSLADNKVGLARISDNRVTTANTATTLMQNLLDANSNEIYNTTIEVLETTYDISLFKIGQIVGFAGSGNFVDRLLLQIVGLTRYPDSIVLRLGVLPIRALADIQAINRDINDIQTIDNPSAPS